MTKHEQIIQYIRDLEVDTKVSVRQIAKELDVSEGTAYRAIKQAERQGLVSSIPKVGTIRIPAEEKTEIKNLSIDEIAGIVEAEVLSGEQQVSLIPENFFIASSGREYVAENLDERTMLVCGNLPEMHSLGIEKKSPMLLTGGAVLLSELLEKAKRELIPVISTGYDTFSAVSMMNNAVYERMTSRELVRVRDIMITDVDYLTPDSLVADWKELVAATGHSRFPVVDEKGILIGLISAFDIAGIDSKANILPVMTKDVVTVKENMLVTHLSRMLVWENFEVVPVVDEFKKLKGIISRQDILASFQQTQKSPKYGETLDNIALSGFKLADWKEGEGIFLSGEAESFMEDELGDISAGILTMIITTASYILLKKNYKWSSAVENMNFYQISSIKVSEQVEVYAKLLKLDKKKAFVEVCIYSEGNLKAKSILMLRLLRA